MKSARILIKRKMCFVDYYNLIKTSPSFKYCDTRLCRPDADEVPTEEVCEGGKEKLAKTKLVEIFALKSIRFWA